MLVVGLLSDAVDWVTYAPMSDPINVLVCRLDLDRTSSLVCQSLSSEADKNSLLQSWGDGSAVLGTAYSLEDPGLIPITHLPSHNQL